MVEVLDEEKFKLTNFGSGMGDPHIRGGRT